jgi:hypothetical protein
LLSASPAEPSALLRAGLLEGVTVVLARADVPAALSGGSGADRGPARSADGRGPGAAIAATCLELGALVVECPLRADPPLELDEAMLGGEVEAAAARALEASARDGALLVAVDAASLFARAGAAGGVAGARQGLRWCLAVTWIVTRAAANRAFLAEGRAGRIVYVAPAGAGEHADAARAGLENLARTLSIEWARWQVTTVAIAPGERGGAEDVAALTAYLASPAGAYFSGCLLDLRGTAGWQTDHR